MTVQQLRTASAAQSAPTSEVVSLFASWRGAEGQLPLRIAMIGTYGPRKCGIATFTSDTVEQLAVYHPELALDVYALDAPDSAIAYEGIAGTIVAARRLCRRRPGDQ